MPAALRQVILAARYWKCTPWEMLKERAGWQTVAALSQRMDLAEARAAARAAAEERKEKARRQPRQERTPDGKIVTVVPVH